MAAALKGKREFNAEDPQAFILKQGWSSVSLDGARGLMDLRSLYEHLQARELAGEMPFSIGSGPG